MSISYMSDVVEGSEINGGGGLLPAAVVLRNSGNRSDNSNQASINSSGVGRGSSLTAVQQLENERLYRVLHPSEVLLSAMNKLRIEDKRIAEADKRAENYMNLPIEGLTDPAKAAIKAVVFWCQTVFDFFTLKDIIFTREEVLALNDIGVYTQKRIEVDTTFSKVAVSSSSIGLGSVSQILDNLINQIIMADKYVPDVSNLGDLKTWPDYKSGINVSKILPIDKSNVNSSSLVLAGSEQPVKSNFLFYAVITAVLFLIFKK